MGLNNEGNPYFEIIVSGSIDKTNYGGTIICKSTRMREWIADYETFVLTDDTYLISGLANSISAAGTSFTVTISKSLRKEIGCKNMVRGTFELLISGSAIRTFDYRNSLCDNIATLTILKKTFTIILN